MPGVEADVTTPRDDDAESPKVTPAGEHPAPERYLAADPNASVDAGAGMAAADATLAEAEVAQTKLNENRPTKGELEERARELEIPGRSSMDYEQLEHAIAAAEANLPPT